MNEYNGSCRAWISPLTAISFLAVSLTGVLMFFHVRLPGMRALHEWGGFLFILLGVWHIVLNWKPFVSYLACGKGRLAFCAGLAATVLVIFFGTGQDARHGREGGGPPMRQEIPER